MSEFELPPGYRRMHMPDPFSEHCGPFYSRIEDGVPTIGFRVEERHVNPIGYCHGASLACLADMQALAASYLAGIRDRFTPTINLTMDYVAAGKLGDWLELDTKLLKRTPNLLFSHAVIYRDKAAIVRSSGIFRLRDEAAAEPSRIKDLFD